MSLLKDSVVSFEKDSELEPFIVQIPTLTTRMDGQAVKDFFDLNSDAEGVVIMENDSPVGIIMRTAFFQQMGSLYGHSLYMKRPVGILMDCQYMKVDITDPISKIGIEAMSREQSKLYDYIVVYNKTDYVGIISIRQFLVELSKRNEAQISVLKDQQQKLIMANEQEVHLRKKVEYQSASIQNLLDHADQGFFWFGKDLMIQRDYSYKCRSIFDQSIGEQYFIDLVAPYFGEEKSKVFSMAFESYFKNNSSVTDHVYLMLLPSDCVILGKNIHFEYRRIESNGEKAVMVILNDITEKVTLEKAMEDDRNKQRLLLKAFSCQAQIKQMLDEFHEIFSGGYRNYFQSGVHFTDSLNELFRSVHTFKGDFAQYGFISASDQLHEFEDALIAVVKMGEEATMADVDHIMRAAEPDKMLQDDLAVVYEVLGDSYFDQSEVLSVSKSKVMEIEAEIQRAQGPLEPAAVLHLIEGLKRKNIKDYLEQYRDYLQYLSGRMMKAMPLYRIEGDDVYIDGDRYNAFIKSLVHIFRNIMDHGIETDEERVTNGKEMQGLVECRITRGNESFTLCISDDGHGINIDRVRKKAIEKGICTEEELQKMTEKEILNLIFADQLSTKESANSVSGRGMGMPAFLEACKALGGSVEISSEENKGTSFQIKLPYAI